MIFAIYHVISCWSGDERIIWLYGWELLKVKCHTAKFGDHSNCGIGDITTLACFVISQNHVIKGLWSLWLGTPHSKSPSCQVWWPKALSREI